jgi:hypothetical protein
MADTEMIQEKIGEAIGLERAAQKAVETLDSRGLLKPEQTRRLSKMKEEAGQLEQEMEEIVQDLTDTDGFDSSLIEDKATETADKASQIMDTYLGGNPDTQDAIEFLCLAEGGEVTHYEVLGTRVRSILKDEKRHLDLWTKLAKSNASSE